MSLDVSFWELPDWRKESSISPVFIGLITTVVAILISGLYYFSLVQTEQTYLDRIKLNESQNQSLLNKFNDLKQIQVYTEFMNKSILNPLLQQQEKILFASTLFQEFQDKLPDSIVLNKFSFDAFKSAVTKKGSKPALRYRLLLKGYAMGSNSENIVGNFVKKLRSPNQFKDTLVSVSIQGRLNKVYSQELSNFKTVFSIDCTFEKGDKK